MRILLCLLTVVLLIAFLGACDDASNDVPVAVPQPEVQTTENAGTPPSPMPCEHIAADAVRENEYAATCEDSEIYDSVVYCSACGEELSRETLTGSVGPLGHSYGNWVVSVAPTETQPGEKTKTCSGCGDVITEEIPAGEYKDDSDEPFKGGDVIIIG